jgi:crotonobetainyl-CoA:carnitine CoA-transferase CaiB-like acyl-CoA transferase
VSVEDRPGPLADLRVVDCATVIAGPGCARYLADFGADVIKVERPGGDTTRDMGWRDPADDVALWWKLVGRGKRTIALDLKDPADLAAMRRLVDSADVLVENFRPGTMEKWGLGYGELSGIAAINGEPGGGPLLPAIALTDEVAALVAAFATMVAVHSGTGQVVDVNLLESLFQLMGPLVTAHLQTGYEQPRLGSGIPYSVPRGTYRCADGRYVAISTSAGSVAERVMRLVGAGDNPRFATFAGRIEHREEVDRLVGDWVAARPLDEVLAAFEEAHAAAAPVFTMADIVADPHYAARRAITEVGGVPMQGLVAKLSATPGVIRWPGRPVDADRAEILDELDAN